MLVLAPVGAVSDAVCHKLAREELCHVQELYRDTCADERESLAGFVRCLRLSDRRDPSRGGHARSVGTEQGKQTLRW
jgi:hypothetical protein